jgi:hypothetical protein
MASSFKILTERGLLVTRFRDRVTDEEFVGLYRRLLGDPRYETGLTEVADLRQVDDFRVTTSALRTVDGLIRARLAGSAGCQTLIIAPGNLPYGLARLYGALADGGPEQVRVYRTLEETAEGAGLAAETLRDVLDEAGARARSRRSGQAAREPLPSPGILP